MDFTILHPITPDKSEDLHLKGEDYAIAVLE